ncbi:very short patch repair endonuclease [Botrimarina sp.]|uniref:very short patch repair endonuclease n=1 Tax=Botrimarina sp. TaxID=2795802 RepID=UPI0032EEBED9
MSNAISDDVKAKAPLTRSAIMKRVKQKDTPAELALRSALHRRGLRFRLHRRIEGIAVDIVFIAAKVAVFVDGCFWHGCPLHATYPKSNQSYWLPKLAENMARDHRQTEKLRAAGWKVIRAWEHDCLPPSPGTVRRVERAVTSRRRKAGSKHAH